MWHLGRSSEALADQNRAVEADANGFALWARGETLRKLTRYSDALRDYDAVAQIAPDYAPTHLGRGIVLWRLGRNEEARRAFDRAVILQPDSYTLTQRADFLIGQKELAEAISDFSEILKFDPSHLGARLNRANALAQLGEYDKSLDDYNVALNAHASDSRIYSGRGWVFQRQCLIGRARKEYRRALELSPTDPRLINVLKNLPQN